MRDAMNALLKYANPAHGALAQRFFKTGAGQYGEGDVFLGISVPVIRTVARTHKDIPLSEIETLLTDKRHECRLLALIILTERCKQAEKTERKIIAMFYLTHADHINNWDLVDVSAPHIIGPYAHETKDDKTLWKLAKSKHLWRERIAVVATFYSIRQNEYAPTLELSSYFLKHPHDLMHKACGWMLREVGKRDEKILKKFLNKHGTSMPRTMLRYAIEKFPEAERKAYLARKKV